jgi:molecular chaperone GrpE
MTSPRERAQLQLQLRQQQEALVKDLLPVLDALDRAEAHWRQVLAAQQAGQQAAHPAVAASPGLWERVWRRLVGRGALEMAGGASLAPTAEDATSLALSASEGIRLIRGALLEALRGHGLESFKSEGLPFDPERMRALGQRSAPDGAPAGRVLEEAVRGYIWRQNLLREAQVFVAGP